MATTIEINLAASLIDSDAKTNMRLLNKLISTPMVTYEQGTLILAAGTVDQEIANMKFNKIILISSELITIKVGSSTATGLENSTIFVLSSDDSNSLFLSNSTGTDAIVEFVFVS